MQKFLSPLFLFFSLESLDKKISYVSTKDESSAVDQHKLKIFMLLKTCNAHSLTIDPSLTTDIQIVPRKNATLLKCLYLMSFKFKFCQNFKNKAVSNYFRFFSFLCENNSFFVQNSALILEDDIYLETLALNNLYNIYHIEHYH